MNCCASGQIRPKQRRAQHDAGHHLADHARLAEVNEQLSQPAAQQQDRNQREQHVIQRAELVRRGSRSCSSSRQLAATAGDSLCPYDSTARSAPMKPTAIKRVDRSPFARATHSCGSDAMLGALVLMFGSFEVGPGLSRRVRKQVKISSSSHLAPRDARSRGARRPLYSQSLVSALANTRSITRMFATASASGVGTGWSSRIARANASACSVYWSHTSNANLFNLRRPSAARLQPHAARPIGRRVERDLDLDPARRAEDVHPLIRRDAACRK